MNIKMLFATLPEGTNLSGWCRRFGVSRQTAYKWRARYREGGMAGLEDRPRGPRCPGGRTPAAVEDEVVAVRKELAGQGLDYGPGSIRDRLAGRGGPVLSDATVWRILVRRGQINAQPAKRPRHSWRRWQRSRPNELWQGDDTHYLLAGGQEVRIINLVDDHSRLNVDALAVIQCRTERVWESFCRAVERYGVPAEFLSDNGRAWRSPLGHTPVLFQACLARLGVRDTHSRPYHPQTCGKVERFHWTQRRWLDQQPVARTVAELQDLLDRFRDLYNHERPHRAIGRRTPAHVWAAQEPVTPPRAAQEPPTTIARCMVMADGTVKPSTRTKVGIGMDRAGQAVTVIRRGTYLAVIHDDTGELLRELTTQPGRRYYGTGKPRSRRSSPGRATTTNNNNNV